MSRRDALIVAAAAALTRLLAWSQLSRTPFWDSPVVDASTFDLWARAIQSGTTFGGATGVFFKPPLYPYLLSGIYGAFGPSPAAAYAVQMVVGVATCLLVTVIARRVFGRGVGLAAGMWTALLPVLPFFEAQLLAEGWTILLTLVALERLLPARGSEVGEPSGARLATAGVLLGVAALGRPNLMLLIVVLAGWAAWDAAARRPLHWKRGLVLLVAGFAAILPVTLRNLSVGGEPVLISANMGANLVTGHHDGADGLSAIPVGLRWDDLQLECRQAGQGEPAASSRFLTGRALRWMAENPGRTVELLGRKVLALVSGWEPRNNIGAAWLQREHGVWLLHRWVPGTWLLLPFAVTGLVFVRRRPGAGLLLLTLAVQAASVLPFFVNARFRLPLLPLLAMFAAAGLLELLARRGGRALLAPVIVLLAAGIVVNVDWLGLDDARWKAEDAFNEALIALKPAPGRTPDVATADRMLKRAIELDPDFPDAHERLGVLGLMAGQQGLGMLARELQSAGVDVAARRVAQVEASLAAASDAHAEALRLVPRSYRSAANMGAAALLSGDARSQLARARLAAGDTDGARADAAAAMEHFRRADNGLGKALSIDPTFAEARTNRQVLASSIMNLPPLTDGIRAAQNAVGGGRR